MKHSAECDWTLTAPPSMCRWKLQQVTREGSDLTSNWLLTCAPAIASSSGLPLLPFKVILGQGRNLWTACSSFEEGLTSSPYSPEALQLSRQVQLHQLLILLHMCITDKVKLHHLIQVSKKKWENIIENKTSLLI